MQARSRFVVALAAALGGSSAGSLGCAPQPVAVSSIVGEARANQLAALARYRGEQVRIRGYVLETGVQKVERVLVHHQAVFGGVESQGGLAKVPYPFARVGDSAAGTGDTLLCFFAAENFEAAAELKPGQSAVFEGTVQEFRPEAERSQLVLNHCDVVR